MTQDRSIPLELANAMLVYNPDTGEFRWRVDPRRVGMKPGDVAGSKRSDGYIAIMLKGKSYYAHRVAWLIYHGIWPGMMIDHANGIRSDNRISNLRLATRAQNSSNRKRNKNSTCPYKGITRTKGGKWIGTIRHAGVANYLGTYDTPEEAHDAYWRAAVALRKEFARAA